MSSKNDKQGRAYEYACLVSLQKAIAELRPSKILRNSSYEVAEEAWYTLTEELQCLYTLSAQSTIATIFALEPTIVEEGDGALELYIQADRKGQEADVRDIIIRRNTMTWEIGLSIKHNHEAVKHSRLS